MQRGTLLRTSLDPKEPLREQKELGSIFPVILPLFGTAHFCLMKTSFVCLHHSINLYSSGKYNNLG